MSASNYDVIQMVGQQLASALTDNLAANQTSSSQAGATRAYGEASRFVYSTATGCVELPSVGSMEASGMMLVINDSPNTLDLYPSAGEQINAGGANTKLSGGIAAGKTAFCVRSGTPSPIGGGATVSGLNWRVAVM